MGPIFPLEGGPCVGQWSAAWDAAGKFAAAARRRLAQQRVRSEQITALNLMLKLTAGSPLFLQCSDLRLNTQRS